MSGRPASAPAGPAKQDQPDIDIRDIVDPAAFAHGYPHDVWTALRRESPVHWCEPEGYGPFWAITRHADIKHVSTNPALFSSTERLNIEPRGRREGELPFRRLPQTVVNTDPPVHRKYRELAAPYFRPKVLRDLEDRVREITRELLDEFSGADVEFDFVEDFASWHPLRMICEILGVPRADEHTILNMTNGVFGINDPEYAVNGQSRWAGFMEYLPRLVAQRRAAPGEDLASVLAGAALDGVPLAEPELMMYLVIIATAGHDTTRNALSGGLLALIEHPDQLELLRERPDLAATAAKEFVRWTTPVAHFVRTATADIELGGRQIGAGESLALFYPSGNRDEDVFDEPFAFRVAREPNRHLGFGHGEHFCMGAVLAQMEITVLLEELIPRLEAVELGGEPQRLQTSHIGGLKHLPIRWRLSPTQGAT